MPDDFEEEGDDDKDPLGPLWERRHLKMSITHIEVRLYRRTRTSCDYIRQPPHFVYYLQCDWSGDPVLGSEDEAPVHWWDSLPQRYVVKRRWLDIVRFHEHLVSDLAFDIANGCRRVKARDPVLPSKGDLDSFVTGVAATGDVGVMGRGPSRFEQATEAFIEDRSAALTHLGDIHTIYVANRLKPFFAEVNKMLAELPTELLVRSDHLRKLVIMGAPCLHKPEIPALRKQFQGPSPALMDQECARQLGRRMRKTEAFQERMKKTYSPGEWRLDAGSSIPVRTVPVRGGLSHTGMSSSNLSPSGPTSPSRSPAAAIMKSSSAPMLAGDSDYDYDSLPSDVPALGLSKEVSRLDKRAERLASSHYGFFARSSIGGEENHLGSKRVFWRHMQAKERREVGRRTLLRSGSSGQKRPIRLEPLPPPGRNDFRASVEDSATSHPAVTTRLKEALTDFQQTGPSDRQAMVRDAKVAEIARDVSYGIRVVVFGEPPENKAPSCKPEEVVVLPQWAPPTLEETLKIYKLYKELLRMENVDAADVPSSDDDDSGDAFAGATTNANVASASKSSDQDVGRELMPIRWTTVFVWSERELDFARDFRNKSVCGALNRGLKLFLQFKASPAERQNGVGLSRLFQWTWPDQGPEAMTQMFQWICLYELEAIQQPMPPVIELKDRRQLETIFYSMVSHDKTFEDEIMGGGADKKVEEDDDGEVYLTAMDIAGGRNQGIEARLKNIVDVHTVLAVCGDGKVNLKTFLELMCDDNFRAGEDSTRVLLDDGRKLVLDVRESVGWSGWIFADADMQECEAAQRRLVKELEAEVIRWRQL